MNILVDIGHPAHVHYYRNLIMELRKKGHKITVTAKNEPIIRELLDHYGLQYILMPGRAKRLISKIIRQLVFDIRMLGISRKEKPDITLGTSITITHLTFLTGIPSLFIEDDDDEVVPLSVKFGHPFASLIISPDCLRGKKNKNNILYYPGYHELAYLHPKRFSPDANVLDKLGISISEKYFVMRFSSLNAHHDGGEKGISIRQKLQLINLLSEHGRVFITTEKEIEPELEKYQLKTPVQLIHSILYFSHIFISDSQTMTSEAAMLGVPSLRCNSFAGRISYLQEQEEHYGLTYCFTPDKFSDLIARLNELLSASDLKDKFRAKRNRMLTDKIDVTPFWCWLVENYRYNLNRTELSDDFFTKFR